MIKHFTVVCRECWKVIRVSKTYLKHRDVVRPTFYSLCGLHKAALRAAFMAVLLSLPANALAAESYPATLVRVIDGDTYVLRVELGFDVSITVNIRLEGLDTPERFTPEGRRASADAEALLKAGSIVVTPTGARTFARFVARIAVDGKSLADSLREKGHVKK